MIVNCHCMSYYIVFILTLTKSAVLAKSATLELWKSSFVSPRPQHPSSHLINIILGHPSLVPRLPHEEQPLLGYLDSGHFGSWGWCSGVQAGISILIQIILFLHGDCFQKLLSSGVILFPQRNNVWFYTNLSIVLKPHRDVCHILESKVLKPSCRYKNPRWNWLGLSLHDFNPGCLFTCPHCPSGSVVPALCHRGTALPVSGSTLTQCHWPWMNMTISGQWCYWDHQLTAEYAWQGLVTGC